MRTIRWMSVMGMMALAVALPACAPSEPAGRDSSPSDPKLPEGSELILKPPTPIERPKGPRERIEAAIQNVRNRNLETTNGFWTVFHGILGLGPSVMLYNPELNERVNAVDYICKGGELRGLEFVQTKYGVDVRSLPGGGVGQGHQDQFVAEMSQWNMPADRKFQVFGKEYTFLDFAKHSQMRTSLNKSQELSWAIVIVGQYLGTDAEWKNAYGEQLKFDDLVRYELDADVEQAACGGTHRLFGLTWAYHIHVNKGGTKNGVWAEVPKKIARYRDIAKKYQNGDGTFSTDFFRGPGNSSERGLRINTTGHTLEWLALTLSDEELKEEWVENAANSLALLILEAQGSPVEGGSLYHAAHGLLIYYARIYGTDWLGANAPYFPPRPE